MSPRDVKLPPSVGEAFKRLSQLFRTPRPSQSHAHSPSPSPFTTVPSDVAEEILLHLSGQEILRMKQVR